MTLEQRAASLDHRTDAILTTFDNHFGNILSQAQVRTILALRSRLTLEDDEVKMTAANVRVIKALPQIFRQALDQEGYSSLVTNFLDSFDGGLTTLDAILSDITDGYKITPVEFTAADYAYFDEVKGSVALNLNDSVDRVAQIARQNTMFTVAGNSFEKTAVALAERLHIAAPEASSLAATGISTFYRTIADKGYETIEKKLQGAGKTLEYTYYGPQDKLERPFCRNLTTLARKGRTWSRPQIAAMDNDQLPDVFRTCGGFRCRHQWIVALEN